ncbi:hypothetical protein [Streptomyces sp. NPDC046862]|uniref:hypothetical protein n=1 Tax=Streptomyces sp. NPDC046862 TaxID=3154603 RepID=UPI003452CDC5
MTRPTASVARPTAGTARPCAVAPRGTGLPSLTVRRVRHLHLRASGGLARLARLAQSARSHPRSAQ